MIELKQDKMKKTLLLLLLLPFFCMAQNVEFDENDAYIIRQIIVSMNGQGALSNKQMKQLEKVNDVIKTKGKIPINQIDNEVLLKYAENLSFQYEEHSRSKEGADKFICIMKRLYKSDSTVLDNNNLYTFDKNKIKDEIK